MKVIVYLTDPADMQEAQACLKWALSEQELNRAGAMHHSGKTSFFIKRQSGTVVIHIAQRQKEAA
jgi:hypothetical protein